MRHAARRSSTAAARQRSCTQIAIPLSCALQPLVEVVVGPAAARDGQDSAAPSRVVPSSARRARPRRCDVYRSACKHQNVQWSCLCAVPVASAVEMCVGVCTDPWARARVCSRARVCMCRAGAAERAYPCRKRPARCRAAGLPDVRLAREGTRHGGLFTEVFFHVP